MRRREMSAMTVAAVVLVLAATFYIWTQRGFDSEPVQRTDQQNEGTDAPLNQTLSPGTVPDEQGEAELPAQEN